MQESTESKKRKFAQQFGNETDPLQEFENGFEAVNDNPFDLFIDEVVVEKDITEQSVNNYTFPIREWQEFMRKVIDRHPACPKISHVEKYARWSVEKGNSQAYVNKKLLFIGKAFDYFQNEPGFPHAKTYHPVDAAKEKIDFSQKSEKKQPYRLSKEELGEKLREIKHIRDRAIILLQLKLGLRASELCNIKLSETHINKPYLLDHYDEMGKSPSLDGRENVVYIPHNREGNKSKRSRTLPLDDEVRAVLLEYLLARPDPGEPWLFLSKSRGHKIDDTIVNDRWKQYWHPEYAESKKHRAVTSHFGRHFFTTWFRVRKDAPEELVKYMRGDKTGTGHGSYGQDAIDHYTHSYYEDIERYYRDEIFKIAL
ncbi:site-specific integrase [Natrinema sp. SYSU A 869]|uniref:tyrosine-type recombinase/integrase n=1 Tax=Natrinema sp. SYSU A 869 TaxID=2871694 RepID=UPI001CA39C3B|nr:site-specific integrase [Natrinema sp. SYSU A 869]